MKKPIEQQVAELTIEQKNNLKPIYRKYLLSVVIVVLIGILLAVGIYMYASIQQNSAKNKMDAIDSTIALNEQLNKYDFSLFDEHREAMDTYYDMKMLKPMALVIGGGAILIGLAIIFLAFKIKYPYFSEKKYTYCKKHEKDL